MKDSKMKKVSETFNLTRVSYYSIEQVFTYKGEIDRVWIHLDQAFMRGTKRRRRISGEDEDDEIILS